MRIRILGAVAVALMAGAFTFAGAQNDTSGSTTRIKTSKDITPSYVYKGNWYGLVTCNRLQRNGYHVTPDEVKKCKAAGGSYILVAGGSRVDVQPQEKFEQYAGTQIWLVGTMKSQKYGTGPTSDASIEGLYAGGDRPATKFEGVTVISITPTKRDDALMKYDRVDADMGARVSEKAQQ